MLALDRIITIGFSKFITRDKHICIRQIRPIRKESCSIVIYLNTTNTNINNAQKRIHCNDFTVKEDFCCLFQSNLKKQIV